MHILLSPVTTIYTEKQKHMKQQATLILGQNRINLKILYDILEKPPYHLDITSTIVA